MGCSSNSSFNTKGPWRAEGAALLAWAAGRVCAVLWNAQNSGLSPECDSPGDPQHHAKEDNKKALVQVQCSSRIPEWEWGM